VYHGWVNSVLLGHPSQYLRLIHGPRVPIENKPIAAIRLLDACFYETIHELVRDQFAGFHHVLHFKSQRILPLNVLAQHLAGGDMGAIDALLAEQFCLSSLAGAWRAE
jgi:hypothetical protein